MAPTNETRVNPSKLDSWSSSSSGGRSETALRATGWHEFIWTCYSFTAWTLHTGRKPLVLCAIQNW